MSTETIEHLQRIVADESRTEEERRQAAEHILRLQPATQTPEEKAEADRLMIRCIFAKMLCYCKDDLICKFHKDNWHLGA